MNPALLPTADPLGLPAPAGLLTVLLVFTFFLHLLFMNLTLGGTLMAALCHAFARRDDDPSARLASRLVGINTFAISLTITTGVAPLLFLQVLYQQLFYTATILLGWIWFSLVVALTLGYYAVYAYKAHGLPAGRLAGGVWLWIAAALFLVVGSIHVGSYLAHSQPGLWTSLQSAPSQVFADRTFLVRLGHFVLAGIAFSALVCAWWSARRASGGDESEKAMAALASRWALGATVLLVLDGFALLLLQPSEVLSGIMKGGGAVHGPLGLAILLGFALIVILARLRDPSGERGLTTVALAATVVTIALMAVTRHQVRDIAIAGAVDPAAFPVKAQWLNFGLFAVLLVIGLGVVWWMVRTVLQASRGETAEA